MVCVFARKTSEPLASLVKQIDTQIGEHAQLKAFVVLLTRDGDATAAELRKLAKNAGIQHVPLTLHQDSAEVPSYDLSRDADVTVLMWVGSKVVVNRAYKGELSNAEIRAIVGDIPKILGK